MNKILKKVVSISLLTSMICYTTPIFAFTKDETVYSKVDATGKNYRTIVSAHINNSDGLETINDLTNLFNIENTNGDEAYIQDGKSLIWDAKGNDIYYQGESKSDLPISVEIKYELDGVEVIPEDVVGKTGLVTITINYKNNDEHKVYVNGSYQNMFTPFVVIGGTIINNNNKIKSATNAKVINDGTKSIVAGIFFPGLQESLGLSKDTLEIPTEMKITVDAKDFEMGQILTFATPKLMDEENTTLVNEVKNVMNKVNLVATSTKQLKDGADELKAGTEEYNENAKLFNSKMQELSSGVSYMNSQYSLINDGIGQINSGAAEMQMYAGQLKNGIPQIKAGLSQISNGIGNAETENTIVYALTSVDNGLQSIISQLSNVTTSSNESKIQLLNGEIQKNAEQINELQNRNAVLEAEEETEDITAQITLNNKMITLLTENNALLNGTITSLQATDATSIDTLVAGLTRNRYSN